MDSWIAGTLESWKGTRQLWLLLPPTVGSTLLPCLLASEIQYCGSIMAAGSAQCSATSLPIHVVKQSLLVKPARPRPSIREGAYDVAAHSATSLHSLLLIIRYLRLMTRCLFVSIPSPDKSGEQHFIQLLAAHCPNINDSCINNSNEFVQARRSCLGIS